MQQIISLIRKSITLTVPAGLALLVLSGCGSGGTTAMVDDPRVQKFTKDNFEGEVLASTQPVLVDFWAIWCGPCKKVAPIVAELAGDFEGRVKVGKVDVDAGNELAQKYDISAIPTLLIFKDGKIASQIVGLRTKADLKLELEKVLSAAAPPATPPKI